MSDPAEQFALIHVPPPGTTLSREQIMADAAMVGPLSAVAEPVLSSKARDATVQLLNEAAEAIEHEQQLVRQRERAEAQARADAIQTLCDGITKMAHRLDALETKRRADAREARRKARADIEASLPDPEAPGDNAEMPTVTPGIASAREPGVSSFEYVEDEGDPPSGMNTSGIPGGGTMPELPKQMSHPQPFTQTPTAIGGP
jgi:hypothetical protein